MLQQIIFLQSIVHSRNVCLVLSLISLGSILLSDLYSLHSLVVSSLVLLGTLLLVVVLHLLGLELVCALFLLVSEGSSLVELFALGLVLGCDMHLLLLGPEDGHPSVLSDLV